MNFTSFAPQRPLLTERKLNVHRIGFAAKRVDEILEHSRSQIDVAAAGHQKIALAAGEEASGRFFGCNDRRDGRR